MTLAVEKPKKPRYVPPDHKTQVSLIIDKKTREIVRDLAAAQRISSQQFILRAIDMAIAQAIADGTLVLKED